MSLKRTEITAALENHSITVIHGDTGSGKTTQVPQLAADIVRKHFRRTGEWLGSVLVAMPARAPTYTQFRRVCQEADVSPGWFAGCRTHGQKDGSLHASVVFMTIGYLVRLVHTDIIERAAFVILDDTHVRCEELSFLYAMLKWLLTQGQRQASGAHAPAGRCPKVVLMSSVSQVDEARCFFGGNVGYVEASGRRFQVSRYEMTPAPMAGDVDEEVVRRAITIARKEMALSSDVILVFVKGKPEIEQVRLALAGDPWTILPVHAQLPHEQIQRIHDLPVEARHIVLVATNVAEFAVTIRPVSTVISSGRVNRKQASEGCVARVTPAWSSSEQVDNQAGRAGRVAPGKQILCVPRASLPETCPAEITIGGDLRWLVFDLVHLCRRKTDFDWMPGQVPSEYAYQKAEAELLSLGCIKRAACNGELVLGSRGRDAMGFCMVEALHMVNFVLLCNDAGAGNEACAAVAFIQTLITQSALTDTHAGLQKLRAEPVFGSRVSDVLLASKIIQAYVAALNKKEFCTTYNVAETAMKNALELYYHMGEVKLTWTWWRQSDEALALVLETSMVAAAPHLLAYQSSLKDGFHQLPEGSYVKCTEKRAQESRVVLPLDLRDNRWSPTSKCRLAILAPPPTTSFPSCLLLSDSFLELGYHRRSMKRAVCDRLRREGFGETLWCSKGRMTLANACEFVAECCGTADVGLVIYNNNDALKYGSVRAFPDTDWANLNKLVGLLAQRCRRVIFVVPSSDLFPKYRDVIGYVEAAEMTRKRLVSLGVLCVDTPELHGLLKTFDGEHFYEVTEQPLCQAVVGWVQRATCLDPDSLPVDCRQAAVTDEASSSRQAAVADEGTSSSGSAAKKSRKTTMAPQLGTHLEIDGIALHRSFGPWYLRFDPVHTKHYVHCAVCIKQGRSKVGAETHAKSKLHQSNVLYYNVTSFSFDTNWNHGFCLGPDAPPALSLQEAESSYPDHVTTLPSAMQIAPTDA